MARIGEDATDILRPYVAREGLSPHLDRAGGYFGGDLKGVGKLREFVKLLRFYLFWYLGQWRRRVRLHCPAMRHPRVREKLIDAERASRRLARAIFYAMARHRAALRDDQGRQNRIEAVGEDLLTVAATALYAESQERLAGNRAAWELADEFFRTARERVDTAIRGLLRNNDQPITAIGQRALRGEYPSLSQGIIRRTLKDYVPSRDQTPTDS
jgi:hypothetical protein